ncbi:hypothetical protein OSCT_0287 [Oscillochloris trichoides DG-6]|uniref:Uncharacterized protein n=1 Tax=Oscillochloris trichoides DG-6 TaxID=765420 RepID=E1IAD6_9CHLR|nr:hypothetical protein OSCT_0287 [Oscillochloris trichoides DG-6]
MEATIQAAARNRRISWRSNALASVAVPKASNPPGGLKLRWLRSQVAPAVARVPKASNPPGGLKPRTPRPCPRRNSSVPKASNPPGGLKQEEATLGCSVRYCSESLKSARRIETGIG